MTPTGNDIAAARKIIAEFEAFSNAYDEYLSRADDLLGQIEYDSPLYKKLRYFVLGTDHVTRFQVLGKDRLLGVWEIMQRGEA